MVRAVLERGRAAVLGGAFHRGCRSRKEGAEADEAARAMLAEIQPGAGNTGLLQYVSAYWDAGHPHFREREKLQDKKVSALYLRKSREIMRLYIQPYAPFQHIKVDGLTDGMIRRWMLHLADMGKSATRIDSCAQALRAPLAYAAGCGDIGHNPFQNIRAPARARTEKGCLTGDEARRLADEPYDREKKLAALLGVLCGMRLGEVRGLRYEDIYGGMIHITRNWQNGEGLKRPKCGSERRIPLPSVIGELLAGMPGGRGFVFPGKTEGRPVCMSAVQGWFYGMLERIGISGADRKKRRISFHSGRHTFVTLGRQAGISDMDIQALAGHRSGTMMAHYSHAAQVVDLSGAGMKMEAVIGRTGAQL